MVFRKTDDLYEAACLALADGRLFEIGLVRLDKLRELCYANWAGDRIICLGINSDIRHYPEPLKSAMKQEREWMKTLEGDELCQGSSASMHWRIQRHYTPLVEPYDRLSLAPFYRRMWRSPYDLRAFDILIRPTYPDSTEQVLCNLSKGEYVRAAALPVPVISEQEPLYGWISQVSLAHALLSRICWAPRVYFSTPYAYTNEPDPIRRGVWAGDRFEVTTMDRLKRDISWQDVGDEFAESLTAILTPSEAQEL